MLVILVLFFVTTPVYAQLLSDATGLVTRLEVETLEETFEIKLVSNFDIVDFSFDDDEQSITLNLDSSLENNLAEIMIPQNLLSGNFTFYLNDQDFNPVIQSNEKIHFITMNFTGSGPHMIEIFATQYLDGLSEIENPNNLNVNSTADDANYIIWLSLCVFIIVAICVIIKKIKK